MSEIVTWTYVSLFLLLWEAVFPPPAGDEESFFPHPEERKSAAASGMANVNLNRDIQASNRPIGLKRMLEAY